MSTDKISLDAVISILHKIYDGETVSDKTIDQIASHCEKGFNALSIDGGTLNLYFGDNSSIQLSRVYERRLTDEEIHLLATEHLEDAPEFDPENIIYTIKV